MVFVKRIIHSAIMLKNKNLVLYIDPYKIQDDSEKADLILISHDHYDHLSIEDIKKIVKDETKIILPKSCIEKVLDVFEGKNIVGVIPEQTQDIMGIKIETIPAYNTNKQFHKKVNDWIGFVITIDDKRIYYAGDTDLIPEMNLLYNIDLSILPVSGVYVMDPEEAANATTIIDQKLAMPCHYGDAVGTEEDAKLFKRKTFCDVVFDEVEL